MKIGNYTISDKIEEGCNYTTYCAYHESHQNHRFRLKVIDLEFYSEGERKELIREAQIWSQLECSFIIQILDFFVENNKLYIGNPFDYSYSHSLSETCSNNVLDRVSYKVRAFKFVHMILNLHSLGIPYRALNFSTIYIKHEFDH
jgi:serine/threonine protein kinase